MPETESSDEKRDATSFHDELPNAMVWRAFLKKLIYFLLKDNNFTEFCCFLSNLNMNQPQVNI